MVDRKCQVLCEQMLVHLENNIVNFFIPFICPFPIGQKEKTLASNSVQKTMQFHKLIRRIPCSQIRGNVCCMVGVGVNIGRGETKDGYVVELAMTCHFCYFLD